MPLPPLTPHAGLGRRLAAWALALPTTAFLFASLIVLNLAQVASLLLRPFSRRAFRAFNRGAAGLWWGLCVLGSRHLRGIRLEVTGDEVPRRENAIVVANHQEMPDITFLLIYARTKERLGDLKWMVKDLIKYVPGVGWGMAFLDCVFVKRSWADDQASIERTFSSLVRGRVPLWLVSFPEGTRLTAAKLEESRAYAAHAGTRPPRHVLVPRTKGFVASVRGLRGHAEAVYDVTIGYEGGVPTLWQYVLGYCPRAHFHVRRYPVRELPVEDAALAAWLLARFEEKDELLEGFYQGGSFPTTASLLESPARLIC
jgi:1-acyl-sn-glycerol-3-phosphate acyltransferase